MHDLIDRALPINLPAIDRHVLRAVRAELTRGHRTIERQIVRPTGRAITDIAIGEVRDRHRLAIGRREADSRTALFVPGIVTLPYTPPITNTVSPLPAAEYAPAQEQSLAASYATGAAERAQPEIRARRTHPDIRASRRGNSRRRRKTKHQRHHHSTDRSRLRPQGHPEGALRGHGVYPACDCSASCVAVSASSGRRASTPKPYSVSSVVFMSTNPSSRYQPVSSSEVCSQSPGTACSDRAG